MATREQRRAALVPDVARTFRPRDFRTSFAGVLGSSQHAVIIALPDDTMGYVFDRLADYNDRAVLVMGDDSGPREMALMAPASAARLAVAAEEDGVSLISETSHVAMLFELLREVRIAVIKRTSATLMDERDLVPSA